MKKIEYKDVDKIISEKNEVARFCEILTANLRRLKSSIGSPALLMKQTCSMCRSPIVILMPDVSYYVL